MDPSQARVLIDTGAEVCLVRKGLLPDALATRAERPLRLVAANNQRLPGGKHVVQIQLQFEAVEVDSQRKVLVTAPSTLYLAEMEEDIILSYQWLGERSLEVCPRSHGLRTRTGQGALWIPGLRVVPLARSNAKLVKEPLYVQVAPVRVTTEDEQKKRALDLFCGRKSVAKVLQQWGYEVVTLDSDPRREPTICEDILEWDYKVFPPGYFHIVAASPPCTEYSCAKTTARRELAKADAIVARTLEIIRYLAPERWWLETPRTGILARRERMQQYPYVDVDYCQFEKCGYQKPTRFFGSRHLNGLHSVLCDRVTCSSLVWADPANPGRQRAHRAPMGGPSRGVRRESAYHIPVEVVKYVAGLEGEPLVKAEIKGVVSAADPEEPRPPREPELMRAMHKIRLLRLWECPNEPFSALDSEDEDDALEVIALREQEEESRVAAIKGGPEGRESAEHPLAEQLRQKLLEEFGESSLSGKYVPNPPVRGPDGEAQIWLKPDAKPVSVPPFQLTGERRQALSELVERARETGKLEDGRGPWNTPAFPVPKKTPGTYRLVQDLRPQNEATLKDGHPLPRISEMLQRQARNCIWTTLDLVDGFHQMPLRKEDRYITCMSTPKGTQQWTVQVMGLKNAGTQFQRMMEWVLRPTPDSDPYMDDVITGSMGQSLEEALLANYEAVRKVLLRFCDQTVVCNFLKSEFFQVEVVFVGHVLRAGRRSPAPGKLMPIRNWQLPKTVTELRGFLGITNYYSEYVHHYAEVAAPLMGKLRLNRQDGRKGSKLRLIWTEDEKAAFQLLKDRLCEKLELWQMDLDRPFRLRCDASDFAIGAELQQEIDGGWRPVSFFSRKLSASQLNWTPREKETYAIVESLRKWAGVIGYRPVTVTTDHKSLENWTTEKSDTPSGPRGRRSRWHSTLAQFDITVEYVPGPDNVVADALSRWAYPASSAREDVSLHGSAQAREEVRELIRQEREDEEALERVRTVLGWERSGNVTTRPGFRRVLVVTRKGTVTENPGEGDGGEYRSDGGSEGGDLEGPPTPTYDNAESDGNVSSPFLDVSQATRGGRGSGVGDPGSPAGEG